MHSISCPKDEDFVWKKIHSLPHMTIWEGDHRNPQLRHNGVFITEHVQPNIETRPPITLDPQPYGATVFHSNEEFYLDCAYDGGPNVRGATILRVELSNLFGNVTNCRVNQAGDGADCT